MIATPIRFITPTPKGVNLQKQIGFTLGNNTQRFEITRPRGLDMDSLAPVFPDQRINTEFIRAGMQTEFIRSEVGCHGGMLSKLSIQLIQISNIVHTFFEA